MPEETQLTPEQVQQYKEQFQDYPQVLEALEVIEECEGNLDESLILISLRKTGVEPERMKLDLEKLAQQARSIVCAAPTRTTIELINILSGAFGTYGIAVAVFIYILNKYALEKFCQI
ncbi:MAG: hypothetical protein QNJ54_32025 [Prochloraceae cyanobacterium]|nr:hypothetical protein [Prochloraceae cyanobacterium]